MVNNYKIGSVIIVNDKMQTNYSYILGAPTGQDFDKTFKPYFTPSKMVELGVFEGKYINDCTKEFPNSWFVKAKLSQIANPKLNFFECKSRQNLSKWRENGWIYEPDPRGWFQWYCRYYLGRRVPEIDEIQIKRWIGFSRHSAQIAKNCPPGNLGCRPRQRQALLQWSYNPFI